MSTSTEVATRDDSEVGRPLHILIPLIKEDLRLGDEAAKQAGLPYYRSAGKKMIEAKPQVRGQFEAWIKRTFEIHPTQARKYMSLARATAGKQNETAIPFNSLADFQRRHLGRDVPTSGAVHREWRESVDKIAEQARDQANRVAQETLSRREEREAQRQLGLRLIDIGFKVLAKELHTDRGGPKGAMARLNEVRRRLNASA